MSKTLIALLVALPFAAPVAATQYLRVVNATSSPIVAVEAAPVGSSDWAQLSLADRPLAQGRQLGVAVHGVYRCRYDVHVIHADGSETLSRGFNLCRRLRSGAPTLTVRADEA
ncbi:MAG: hypothetical protein B7X33_06735 [Lysobacterales bacterium 13-68-4]|jgi:hypothetical protein|nr:MAG: hypothetical protein B7X33_06735 [Xanthomonadales bacterium 13-68-4]OZB60382.1 MAG: hypothetical protein B7X45_07390 [Xanthomonadales bacterium 15-68-25]OZB67091.1 MAG: hypothetical protein B7X39_07045 [Xanthomonadales bacterium 14-68-21]